MADRQSNTPQDPEEFRGDRSYQNAIDEERGRGDAADRSLPESQEQDAEVAAESSKRKRSDTKDKPAKKQ